MSLQHQPHQEVRPVLKTIFTWSGIGITLLAMIGMFQLSPPPVSIQNGETIKVRPGQKQEYVLPFGNTSYGNFQNEGEVFFHDDLTNYGRIDCGSCESGITHLVKQDSIPQILMGSRPMNFLDLHIRTQAGVQLQTSINIHGQLTFERGMIYSNKKDKSTSLHFEENGRYQGHSDSLHIQGWVSRTGQGTFAYPIGDGLSKRTIFLKGKSIHSTYTATFLHESELIKWDSLNYMIRMMGFPDYLSDAPGVWLIDGNEETKIIISQPAESSEEVVILGWKDENWEQLGSIKTTHGLETQKAIVPSDFSAFTLAIPSTSY
ncbi:MAG: hypothetical protein AAFY71_23715 [Bacteroidota bacterium]